MKIFLSSTKTGLGDERRKVIDQIIRLREEPVAMEYFSASVDPPLEECLARLAECDLVVLLLGPRYGSIHPPTGRSYTENEYLQARASGKGVLVFVKQGLDELLQDGSEESTKYREFLNQVMGAEGQTVDFFESVDDLAARVSTAIANGRNEIAPRLRALVSAESYFEPLLDPASWFNHSWQLVGRDAVLQQLVQFTTNEDKQICVVFGPGGTGKSRLVLELARRLTDRGTFTLFLRDMVPFSPDLLSGLREAVVVLEDAHQYGDVEKLLACCSTTELRGRVKLICTARPSGKRFLESLVFRFFDETRVAVPQSLGPLEQAQVEELAKQALANPDSPYVRRLVEASADCPLVTVVGGRLVAAGLIAPELLERNESFRRVVLSRFTEEMTRRLPDPRERWIRLLPLLAALAPFRLTDQRLLAAAAPFVRMEPYEILGGLQILIGNGLLSRRGDLVRIVPDVLADNILYNECVTDGNIASGYADAIFSTLGGVVARDLLRNLAEMQWRIDQTDRVPMIMDGVWRSIEDQFEASDAARKAYLLGIVRDAAAYQPAPALRLVKRALGVQLS